eukprot:scaffold96875_cov35-Tisochrysis_lutea.AAC.2
MTLEEAAAFSEARETRLTAQVEDLSSRAAELKAKIKIAVGAVDEHALCTSLHARDHISGNIPNRTIRGFQNSSGTSWGAIDVESRELPYLAVSIFIGDARSELVTADGPALRALSVASAIQTC